MPKKSDVVLIASAVLGSVLLIFIWIFFRSSGEFVVISVDNNIVERLALTSDKIYEIRDSEGNILNIVAVEGREVYMSYGSCPDKICVNQGAIMYENEVIVCLPNRVVIEIKNGM